MESAQAFYDGAVMAAGFGSYTSAPKCPGACRMFRHALSHYLSTFVNCSCVGHVWLVNPSKEN